MPHLPVSDSQEEDSKEKRYASQDRAFSDSSGEHEHHKEAPEVDKSATTVTRKSTRTTTTTQRKSLRASEKAVEDALLEEQEATYGGKAASLRRSMSQSFDPSHLSCWRRPFYAIVVWPGFDSFIGLVILANGMTIGFDTQAQARIPIGCDDTCTCIHPGTVCKLTDPWVGYLDLVCYGIYIAELVLRFVSFGPRAIKSHWVKFDLFLVGSATVDLILKTTAVSAEFLKQVMLVRLLRLARLARLVRLVVQFQTLWKLVSGLMSCANTLFWTFLLISILSYIAALFGMDLITYDLTLPADHPYNIAAVENFGALDDAMFTLMQLFTFDSIAGIYRPLIQHKPLLFFYFMAVLLVLSIALMNLVTAIMVEGALAIAEEDKEVRKRHEQVRKKRQMAQLQLMFGELDEDGSGELTLDEINSAPPDVKASLFEIAGTEITTLFEMLDYDGGGTLETDEFCHGVFKAASSTKPLELDRLLRQCRDILGNSRKALNMIRGEGSETEQVKGPRKSVKQRGGSKLHSQPRSRSGSNATSLENVAVAPSAHSPRSPRLHSPRLLSPQICEAPKKTHQSPGMVALETRVHALERMASNMQEDTERILHLLYQNVKRAPAAARGPSYPEDLAQTLRPTSAEVELQRSSGRKKKKPPIVYSWSASPAVDADEVVVLRRRVAQLEAEIRKRSMQEQDFD